MGTLQASGELSIYLFPWISLEGDGCFIGINNKNLWHLLVGKPGEREGLASEVDLGYNLCLIPQEFQKGLLGMVKLNDSCINSHVSIFLEQHIIYNCFYEVNPLHESRNLVLGSLKLSVVFIPQWPEWCWCSLNIQHFTFVKLLEKKNGGLTPVSIFEVLWHNSDYRTKQC